MYQFSGLLFTRVAFQFQSKQDSSFLLFSFIIGWFKILNTLWFLFLCKYKSADLGLGTNAKKRRSEREILTLNSYQHTK